MAKLSETKEGRCVEMARSGAVPDRRGSRLILSILVLTVFLLSGCDRLRQLARQPEISKKQQGKIARLEKKIQSLELQLAGVQQEMESQRTNVEQRFSTFDSSLNSLGTRYAVLDSDINKHKSCIFQNNSKEVQRLDTDLGPLLVSLDAITSDNGEYKLILNICNPLMSEISEFGIRLRYGKQFNPSGHDSYDDWLKSLKLIDKSFKQHLKPGQWNKIEVPLGKLQADEVKYVALKMTVDNIIITQQQPPQEGSPGVSGGGHKAPARQSRH